MKEDNIIVLSTGEQLIWEQKGENVEILMPDFNPDSWPEESMYAFVFKIER